MGLLKNCDGLIGEVGESLIVMLGFHLLLYYVLGLNV